MSDTDTQWHERDAATLPWHSCDFDYDRLDSLADQLRELLAQPNADAAIEAWLNKLQRESSIKLAAEMFRVALISIMTSPTPKRECYIWAMAAGMECTMGLEQKQVAEKFHIKKQAISKAINDRIDRLGLCRNRQVMSENSRHTQRDVQLRKHGKTREGDSANYPTRRIVMSQSIEAVLLRFKMWQHANHVNGTMEGWDRNRLEVIASALKPIAACYERVTKQLESS